MTAVSRIDAVNAASIVQYAMTNGGQQLAWRLINFPEELAEYVKHYQAVFLILYIMKSSLNR